MCLYVFSDIIWVPEQDKKITYFVWLGLVFPFCSFSKEASGIVFFIYKYCNKVLKVGVVTVLV